MSPTGDFDLKEYFQVDTPKDDQEEVQSMPPYPEANQFLENGHVAMPEVQARTMPLYYPEQHVFRQSRGPQLDLNIPSITLQADEQRTMEIYSPLNPNGESPYEASYEISSPFSQNYVPSPAASPGFEGSGDEAWDFQESWQDQQQINQFVGDFLDPRNTVNMNPFPDHQILQQQPQHLKQSLQQHSVQQPALQQPAQQPLQQPLQAQQQQQQQQQSQQSYPGPDTLQVPGSELYPPASPDYYLSAPSSPSFSPSSPNSGRSSPLLGRPRAYSSPYDLSTDNDASSPGDTGQISGTKRRTKKNASLYPCNQCEKKFTRAYNLRSHMRTHTHERPFACAVCGKAFARQHDRKRHEDLHTGEKRFVCQGNLIDQTPWGCGRKFARADALGRHFRTEAGKSCMAPLREDAVAKIGQRVGVSEGIVFLGVLNGEAKLDVADPTDDYNQTRRAVIMSALAEQLS